MGYVINNFSISKVKCIRFVHNNNIRHNYEKIRNNYENLFDSSLSNLSRWMFAELFILPQKLQLRDVRSLRSIEEIIIVRQPLGCLSGWKVAATIQTFGRFLPKSRLALCEGRMSLDIFESLIQ